MIITVYYNAVDLTEELFLTKDIKGLCCIGILIKFVCYKNTLNFKIHNKYYVTNIYNRKINTKINMLIVYISYAIYLNELYLFRCQRETV